MAETTASPGAAGAAEQPSLRRVMGPGLLLLFVVGDILGTGIYALTGQVAAGVGGAVWVPFVVAFLVAIITAFSYLELVTKYPRAAGAALYTHKAFGVHFLTFIVAFAVMSSGITSASTASRAFAANLGEAFDLDFGDGVKITLVALAFITLIAIVNFRGVGESVKANVVLTCVELSGLPIDHLYWPVGARRRWRRLLTGDAVAGAEGPGSVRCGHSSYRACILRHGRLRGFGEHGRGVQGSGPDLPQSHAHRPRHHGDDLRPGLDHGSCPGVAGSARRGRHAVAPGRRGRCSELPTRGVRGHRHVRGGELGADQHAHGQQAAVRHEPERVLPEQLGMVHPTRRTPYVAILFTTALAFGLIAFVGRVPALGGTTALLLLGVFTIVNIAVLVLRRDPVDHEHFVAPTALPVIGAFTCAYLASPMTDRDPIQYQIATVLLLIGVLLWLLTRVLNRTLSPG
jgi:Amino acid permease